MATVFSPNDVVINDLFGLDISYIIPPYQRPYSWDCIGKSDRNNQINVMWDDLIEAFDLNKDDDYFFGSMVMIEEKGKTRIYTVIDGQQRLTSMILFFVALKGFLKEQNEMHSILPLLDKESDEIKAFIKSANDTIENIIYNKHGIELVQEKKIKIEKRDGFDYDRILKDVMEGGAYDKSKYEKEDDEKRDNAFRYYNNRDYIVAKLRARFAVEGKINKTLATELNSFFGFIRNKVSLVRITCTNFEVAYKVFEILNNRGLPLSNKDLFRNFIIQEFDAIKNENPEKYKDMDPDEKWNHLDRDYSFESDFLSRWVESITGMQQKLSAFNDIKEIYGKRYEDGIDKKKIELFYEDFERDLGYYTMLFNDEIKDISIKSKINFLLHAPNERYIVNLLIAVFRYFKYDGAKNNILKEFLTSMEQLVLFYLLVAPRYSSSPFLEACRTLFDKNLIQAQNAIKLALKVVDPHKGIPDIASELSIRLGNRYFDNSVAKLILCKYVWTHEALKSLDDVLEQKLYFDKATLEHIIPQKPAAGTNWANNPKFSDQTYTLGNMTLLTQRLNSSVKNADWSVKREKYKGTKLFITQELVGIDQISPSVIVARTVKILDTIRMDLSLPSSKELKIFAQGAKVNDIKLSHKNKSKVLAK